jgi:hypothetical protein
MREIRDQNVTGPAPRARPERPSPVGPGALEGGPWPRPTGRHASPARDYTPSPAVVLQGRGRRGAPGVAKVNAETDPFMALARAVEYLTSVLRPASRRNWHYAAAWCRATVHVLDALAAAVERGEQPHPWFREPRKLNPAGWAPLAPVTATFRALARRPGQEDTR